MSLWKGNVIGFSDQIFVKSNIISCSSDVEVFHVVVITYRFYYITFYHWQRMPHHNICILIVKINLSLWKKLVFVLGCIYKNLFLANTISNMPLVLAIISKWLPITMVITLTPQPQWCRDCNIDI